MQCNGRREEILGGAVVRRSRLFETQWAALQIQVRRRRRSGLHAERRRVRWMRLDRDRTEVIGERLLRLGGRGVCADPRRPK